MLKSKNQNWLLAIVFFFIANGIFAQNLQISGGNAHTVAICENGDVFAWGKNDVGQLGPTGPGGFSNEPVMVTGFPAGLDLRQTDAGSGSHTLALGCDGRVYAWGANATGQLGNNVASGFSATPVQVVGIGGVGFLSGVKYVSGGNDESFAILNDGRLVSWGQNDKGQLGNNTTTDRAFPNYVLKCDGTQLTNVIQVEAGDENCYALLADGSVWSWGDNLNNAGAALGRPAAVNPHCAQKVVYGDNTDAGFTTTPVTNIISISAGDRHVLMLDATGSLWSFGGDWGAGQLGQGKGYQYSAHKVLAPKAFNSPWTTDPYTIANEYNTGPYLTGVTSISAGQAHSMAVLDDGSIVTFGANGFFDCGADCAYLGGQLGIGMTLGNKISATDPGKGVEGPVYGLTGPGVKLENVVSVSDGDAISIAILANGDVYIAGSNSYGQVGIGSGGSAAGDKSDVGYFTKITIPTCAIATPCPLKPNLGADFSKCAAVSQTLYANVAPRPTYNYSWEYSLTGTAPWNVIKNVTTFPTANADNLTVTTNGYYRLIISDDRASLPANCAPCTASGDTIQIKDPVANFGDPGNLKFCGTNATVHVTETGSSATTNLSSYEWYAALTGGTALATTVDATTALLDVTTLTKTGTAPNRTAEVWVEDKSTFNAILAKKADLGAIGNQQTYGSRRINFIPIKSFSLNSVIVEWKSYSASTITLTLKDAGGASLATGSFIAAAAGDLTSTITFSPTPALAAGGSYYIESDQDTRQYNTVGNAYSTNFQNAGIDILDITSYGTSSAIDIFPPFYAWNVTVGSPYPCGRLKVLIKEDCPPCNKPTSVTVNGGTSPINKCVGDAAFTTTGSYVNAGNPVANTTMAYVWYKQGSPAPAPAAYTNLTAPTPVATTASQTVPVRNFTSPVVGDAGTYILRVEDGTAGNALCYTEKTVVLNVNPVPTISSAATGSVCSGVAQNYSITSVVPSSYVWSRAVVAGISNLIATAQTTNPITETLTNTTNAAIVVRYVITPTSTTGSCPGPAFNYDVTVNPKPTISSATTGIVCSGVAQSYSITSVVPSSYVWSRAAVTGISNVVATAQTANPITETLTNTTNAAVVVRYIITPTSTTGTCAGPAFNYDVTVNPKPTISSAATGSICSGVAQSYSITSAVASSYSWSRAAVTGVSNATVSAQTANPITETLTNTTNAAVVVRYIITPTSTAGTCLGTAFNYDVTVVPTPTISSLATGSICSGAAQSYAITSVVPSSYAWTRAVVAGISNAIGSGAASPITETLTNTTAASVVVRYIITPTSTAGSCPGTPFNYDVTVIPKPTINSAATGTICTAVAQNYIITSDNPSTYTWTRAAISTINGNVAGSGTSSPITEVLTSTATGPVVVRYVIIPKSITGGCAGPAFNYDVTVSATAAPTVVIVATPSLTICDGDNISLKANPTSGGTFPTYKWTSSEPTHPGTLSTTDTYASTGFKNGEVITVELTSDLGCANPKTATTTATMVVNPIPAPTVSIVVDDADKTICPGGKLIFTATPVQGGTPPAYVWKRKPLVGPAVTVGTNSDTYTTTTAVDGDIYTVEMLSSVKCAPTTPSVSNPITITVTPVPVLNVTIVADKTTICSGNAVNFTATPTGSGSTPAPKYEWFIGAAGAETSQGAATTTNPFSTTSLTTTAALSPQVYSIYVKALSTASCASTTPSQSPAITVTVNAGVVAGTITTAKLTICNNTTPDAITAGTTAASGGTTPVYTWEESIDGGAFGPANGTVNGTGFTPIGAQTGTKVSYRRVVTYSDVPSPCNKSTSNIIDITVLPALVAGVIEADESICINTAPKVMKETATGATKGGAGSGYAYQWQYTDGVIPFTDIPLATNATYTSPAISVTTKFQRLDKSGTCDAVATNIVTKTIASKEIITLTPFTTPVDLCVSATPTVFTAVASSDVPTSTLTYAWTLAGEAVGSNSNTYSYTPVIGNDNVTTKVIKVVVSTSNTCNTGDKSASFTVNLTNALTPTISITTPINPTCVGFPV
ncbi:PKD-like domain-containing protein, partial [uncultured Cytophaga sp.]|uniref:PKD-like domain-containing protein n=1 Tax=uncultured Cytophaga sp. TaxID=160238 RepID=UPI00260C53A5